MSIIKKVFKYPPDMEHKIQKHEEHMLKVYSGIINEKYKNYFEKFGLDVKTMLLWECVSQKKSSKNRIKFGLGYSCSVICEIKRDGEIVHIPSTDGEVDYYPLFARWEISRIDFHFNRPPYLLFNDVDEIYEDMNELQALLEKKVSGIS